MRERPINFNNGYADLEDYGFNCLTGEACAYSMRLLFDVNEKGAEIIRDFMGLPYDTKLTENWNTYVDGKEAIGSVMLTRGTADDLIKWVLLHVEQCRIVYHNEKSGSWMGSDTALDIYHTEDWATYRNHRIPSAAMGSRNVHQMTGRSS